MPVLVTYNVETELDIANGSRATIERIIAHPDSELPSLDAGDTETIHLSRPPLCVLVRLARTKAKALEGLEPGVVPIIPIRSGFQIPLASGQQIKLQREQLPLTPAYAFTDYRSQGQSIPYVIIDIGKPPSSAITPFNAYVALSRSIGRENARLLWDFEDRLFTAAPDKNLTNEDEELERLNKATKSDPRGGKRLGQPSLVETSH
ncbi:hypothetical protein BDV93DRAFT_441959 [Ceratobasidium sp. AG-I]|nr:hypothetical protein BDV93DRAFT_441959 [Ceratobasidium sp. AG-I]